MEKKRRLIGKINILEVISEEIVLKDYNDLLDLLTEAWVEGILLHKRNVAPEFFDLSTGVAGEILNKITTYRLKFAVVGNFDEYPGEAIHAFIRESNRKGDILFVENIDAVLDIWGEK